MNEAQHKIAARELAPSGRLRAALNLGNKVLVQQHAQTGDYTGITPALARGLARRLGVELSFVPHDQAEAVANGAGADVWDICFLAIDPTRAKGIAFTAPYALIAGIYVVPESSSIRDASDVDRAGIRIGLLQGSAYDLHLTRAIQNAELVRAKDTPDVIELMVEGRVDAIAGLQTPLMVFVAETPGYRALESPFMEIKQAIGVPVGREAGWRFAQDFVEEMKATGFVKHELASSGQLAASVAPRA